MRAVIIDSGGVILRTISSPPELFGIQAAMGESVFALTNDDGASIDDANVVVSEEGSFEAAPGAPMDTSIPSSPLELVAV